jgi:hypothetical protein
VLDGDIIVRIVHGVHSTKNSSSVLRDFVAENGKLKKWEITGDMALFGDDTFDDILQPYGIEY